LCSLNYVNLYYPRGINADCPGPKPKALTSFTSAASNTLVFRQKPQRVVGGVKETWVIGAFRSSSEH
jgi:hypothetical protein